MCGGRRDPAATRGGPIKIVISGACCWGLGGRTWDKARAFIKSDRNWRTHKSINIVSEPKTYHVWRSNQGTDYFLLLIIFY